MLWHGKRPGPTAFVLHDVNQRLVQIRVQRKTVSAGRLRMEKLCGLRCARWRGLIVVDVGSDQISANLM